MNITTMENNEYIRLCAKLAVAREIAEDFRENTSLGTIIKDYEARIKEYENGLKAHKTMIDALKAIDDAPKNIYVPMELVPPVRVEQYDAEPHYIQRRIKL